MSEQPVTQTQSNDDESQGQVSEVSRLDANGENAGDTVPTGGSDPGGAPEENERDNEHKKPSAGE